MTPTPKSPEEILKNIYYNTDLPEYAEPWIKQALASHLLWAAKPECGEDFCDSCGDCLSCFSDDWCPDGQHRWVVYEDDKMVSPLTD